MKNLPKYNFDFIFDQSKTLLISHFGHVCKIKQNKRDNKQTNTNTVTARKYTYNKML